MNLLATSFPGITSVSPELLVPLGLIVASFGISALYGIGTSLRDAISRRL
jgi:hypothetical protein